MPNRGLRFQALPLVLPFLLVLLFIGACQAEPPQPPAPKVENAAFGIAFSPLPEIFEVETNDASTLSFLCVGEDDGSSVDEAARLWVELGPTGQSGINLVEIVNSQKAIFEDLPGGEFFGSRELVTPLGPAYYSRGRFDPDEGGRVEEIRLFQLHPGEYRLLTLHYRYPAGEDSAQRLQGLLELASVMEAVGADSPETEQVKQDPAGP